MWVLFRPSFNQLSSSFSPRPQVLSAEQQVLAASNDYNFDHPDAFDFDLLTDTLRKLKQGKSVKIPVYDFTTHGRQKDWVSAGVSFGGNIFFIFFLYFHIIIA